MIADRSIALLFDLDGTLVDSAADMARALSAIRIARGGNGVAVREVRTLVSRGVEYVVSKGLGEWVGNVEQDVIAFRDQLQATPPDPAIVFPAVRETLAVLSDKGFAMAVVTNKPERLARSLLCALDLDRYFSAVVGGDTAAKAKPDAAPLRWAISQMNAGPTAVMIGDSPIDALAARAAGAWFLLYRGGYDAAACEQSALDGEFTDFRDLPGLIDICLHAGQCRSPSGHL